METKEIDQIFDKLEKDLSSDIHVGRLGSCQYSSTEAVYEFALEFLKKDRKLFEKVMGITYDKELSKEEFIENLKLIAQESYETFEDEDEDKPKINTIEDYYEWTRDSQWDLWSAAIIPLENFQIKNETKEIMELVPKTGFIINDMIMGGEGSLRTGLSIAYTTFLFGTQIETFAEFDT